MVFHLMRLPSSEQPHHWARYFYQGELVSALMKYGDVESFDQDEIHWCLQYTESAFVVGANRTSRWIKKNRTKARSIADTVDDE